MINENSAKQAPAPENVDRPTDRPKPGGNGRPAAQNAMELMDVDETGEENGPGAVVKIMKVPLNVPPPVPTVPNQNVMAVARPQLVEVGYVPLAHCTAVTNKLSE